MSDVQAKELEALNTDLGRLNKLEEGLGDRAVAYVNEGTNSSVLLEIRTHAHKALATLEAQSKLGKAKPLRRKSLVERAEWQPALLYRFGELLLALNSSSNGAYCISRLTGTSRAPGWLIALGCEVSNFWSAHITESTDLQIKRFYTASNLNALVAAAGEPPEALLQYFYNPDDWYSPCKTVLGLEEYLTDNVDLITRTLPDLHADGRKRLIEDVARLKLGDAFFNMVFAAAIGSSKQTRQIAWPILQGIDHQRLLRKAKETLASRSGNERRETIELLVALLGREARDFLASHLEGEKSKPVSDAIVAAIARIDTMPIAEESNASGSMLAIDGSVIEIPPVPALPEDTPLPAEALEGIAELIPAYNEVVDNVNEKILAEHKERGWKWKPNLRNKLDKHKAMSQFIEFLNNTKGQKNSGNRLFALDLIDYWSSSKTPFMKQAFEDLFSHPDFTLWHRIRLLNGLDGWQTLLDRLTYGHLETKALLSKLEQGLDFRVPVKMLAKREIAEDHVARRVLESTYSSPYLDVNIPTLPYYFLEHIDLIEEALGQRPRSGKASLSENAALGLLAWMPQIPARLLHPILNVALAGSKNGRAQARALLTKAQGIDDAIIARLTDGKKGVRASTAEWIGTRGMKHAIPALKTALKKDKAEEARAAMLTALSKLGEDISEHFSEKALLAEAKKGLAKPIGKSMQWFPFAAVPHLKWSDGKAVDPTIVKWWIVLAEKLKDPAGNALFELYLDRLKPEDAEHFSLFLLQSFIERDTESCSEEEALAAAKVSADRQQGWWQQWHQRNPNKADEYPFNYDKVFAQAKASKLAEPVHSCSENRGFLGLTMRAPGRDAGALVRRYLKDYGHKVAQSKALLTALARNPAPAAIQVILAVANRHKQKSVLALAKDLIAGIADARGWTADELADRTIPDAGFDETGIMELPCGEGRLFKAIYRGDGKIDLQNTDGKVVKSLPTARNDADKEEVGASKKVLSGARKEVKLVETMQRQRLYEAMCVGRTWEPEIWTSCLQKQVIVGRLCQRLVWLGLDADGKVLVAFRPLEDGSLTSNTDDTVTLDGVTTITLAHQALLSEAESEAWATHLSDYEVAPLFTQFGGSILVADKDLQNATEITDRKGWMIDNLKLQSVTSKLGYDKGEASDGGGYYEYVKRFDGVGLRAVIEFSGSYMGANESFPCALHGLKFEPIPGQRYRTVKALRIGDVPPVLLSEAWGEYHAVAAAGTGFDPEWEKKGFY